MGKALGKKFDKALKAKIVALTNDQLREYQKNGSIMIDGYKIEEEWLKVNRNFNDKYQNDESLACATDSQAAVMLHTAISEELKMLSHQMEVTNRIQKLRKAAGVDVEDPIEVFY